MASPIEATPVLRDDDARRLLEDMKRIAPRAEIERRQAAAAAFLAKMTRPKRAK